MKRMTGYEASDHAWFETREACKAHEEGINLKCLAHMDAEQVKSALDRTNIPLANAIEFAGQLIAGKRRASGDMKRRRKAIE